MCRIVELFIKRRVVEKEGEEKVDSINPDDLFQMLALYFIDTNPSLSGIFFKNSLQRKMSLSEEGQEQEEENMKNKI